MIVYNINHHPEEQILEIEDSTSKTYAKIHLNQGASLQELTLNGQQIIQNLRPLIYENTFASAILFPFANRIKDGQYTFNDQDYQFDINQKQENNALHGLIYNKRFDISDTEVSKHKASVVLKFKEDNESNGFPYTYQIQLKYTISHQGLNLDFSVKNTSSKIFPFTVGWHPYFVCEDLDQSILQFDSTKKIIIGERNIGTGIETIKPVKNFKLKHQQLDDCWVLNSGDVYFKTPGYELKIASDGDNNFMQVYTPPFENIIAIEPTTGVSDSFNNKIGLQVLEPNNQFSISWSLQLNLK
ncbi:aldose 1-epimerase [Tamlana carrageenivorans]|uniref:Aldose 1-epimerase n=1 Tax=Pseudotamlana carrageenivorans TaxID=2069432 RepID=A0A2I7SDN8_9FLAO|nr:aldose 1-epimerase [Tamlana carrageenivorans]